MIGVQDERKTSRSPEIDVNSFCEEPSSSERTERPVTGPVPGKPVHETSVIQTRSSEDRKDFNVEQAHERTGRTVITHDVINVSDSTQTRSAHESETFNVGDETLRERTERFVADDDVSHEQTMVNEANMDFRIPGQPHSVVKHAQSTSVRELIQRVTSNYVNCSRRNPKRSVQCVYHTGIPVHSAARAGISCIKKEVPIRNSSIIRWNFFQSLSMPSRREDFMDIDMVKSRETNNITRLTN